MFGIKRRRLERQRQDALAAYDEAMSLARAEYNIARKAYSDAKARGDTRDQNKAIPDGPAGY